MFAWICNLFISKVELQRKAEIDARNKRIGALLRETFGHR